MGAPVFAVVGHVNKGKSSIVATLAEDDSVAIAHEARTTRTCREFPLRVDGRTLFTLVDTPGFEQARHALAWLRAAQPDTNRRAEAVAQFVRQHRASGEFPEEIELLEPILAGAGILYVVDGSRPYGPEYEAEMEILRWTGQPRMAVINLIGRRDHVAEWRATLDQYFSLVRVFDAHAADFQIRLDLLRAFRELREEWRPFIDEAIGSMTVEQARRRRQSARAIAAMLADQIGLIVEKKIPEGADSQSYRPGLEKDYRDALRRSERLERDAVEDLYQHKKLKRREDDLEFWTDDLFAETTWLRLGLGRRQLAATAALGGAVVGGGIDLAAGGSSLLLGTMLGGAVGALSGWFSKESLSRISIQGLRMGGRLLRIGPMRNAQFPWIALDRALLHHRIVSHRAHAQREEVVLSTPEAKAGIVASLSIGRRRNLEAVFGRLKQPSDPESREAVRAELAQTIESLLEGDRASPAPKPAEPEPNRIDRD